MYYAIFDEQTKCYLATGYNFQSKEEVAAAYISYKSVDWDDEEEGEKSIREMIEGMGLEDVLYSNDFRLDEQEEPFEELN